MKKKLLFILNEPTYFVSHRLPIAIAAQAAGYDIHVATGERSALTAIIEQGFVYHALPLSRSGRNLFSELKSLLAMYRLMKRLQPDLVHLVTIKPVLYGSIAARLARAPAVVAAVSGLGYAFIDQYFEAKCLRLLIGQLYRIAFRHKNLKVIFQNRDDQRTLFRIGAVKTDQAVLIQGSGVDLIQYCYQEEPEVDAPIVVMAARLLRDKGVMEYVEAAKLLRAQGVHARFLLAGQLDPGNPSSIKQSQLQAWIQTGAIEYQGYCHIPDLFSQAHLVVLPSYREGLPRVLAEAAACGRAVITTDVPGCRAAIVPGQTGLLVRVKDAVSLAEAMHQLIVQHDQRKAFGAAGRKLAEQSFDVTKIVEQHLALYRTVSSL